MILKSCGPRFKSNLCPLLAEVLWSSHFIYLALVKSFHLQHSISSNGLIIPTRGRMSLSEMVNGESKCGRLLAGVQ